MLYVLFVLVPIGLAAYYSLYNWNGLGPLTDFVGLDNYKRGARRTTVFRDAIRHNLTIVVAVAR